MSYDLMVFESSSAPRERDAFMAWYRKQAEWSEGHDYQDPKVCPEKLRAWFLEMIEQWPQMNGAHASDDEIDNPKLTDYSIGKEVVYACFAWSCAEEALGAMRASARKHDIGFFDVSAEKGEIVFPGDWDQIGNGKPWWKFW